MNRVSWRKKGANQENTGAMIKFYFYKMVWYLKNCDPTGQIYMDWD